MTLRQFFSNAYVKLIFKLFLMCFTIWLVLHNKRPLIALFSPFVISFVIAYLFNPIVVLLEKKKVPRTIGVLIIYVLFFFLIYFGIAKLIPVIQMEIARLESLIPEYSNFMGDYLANLNDQIDRLQLPETIEHSIKESADGLEQSIMNFLKSIPQIGLSLATVTFQTFMVIILTFYFLRDFSLVKTTFLRFISPKKQPKTVKVMGEIDETIGNYIRGQLLVCTFIGSLTYLWLRIIGVDFAILLGIISGVTNIIPYFGPWIGSVPAVIVALFHSPMLAVQVIIGITVIQQIESAIVAPQIIGKKMGMHPLVVIFALLAGGRFFGILGMIVAVPTTAVIRILLRNFLSHYFPEGVFKS